MARWFPSYKTGSFVTVSQEEAQSQNKSEPIDRTDLLILVNAKKMELSLFELNQFYFPDYIKFSDMYVGNKQTSNQSGAREATQNDIDKLLA